MFHWCPDETAALLAAFPALGFLVRWVRVRFARLKKKEV